MPQLNFTLRVQRENGKPLKHPRETAGVYFETHNQTTFAWTDPEVPAARPLHNSTISLHPNGASVIGFERDGDAYVYQEWWLVPETRAVSADGETEAAAEEKSRFVWTEDLQLGVEAVDSGHRVLVEQAGRLEALAAEGRRDGMRDLLMDMAEEAVYNFAREEGLLDHVGYPELQAHRSRHEAFLEALRGYRSRVAARPESVEIADILDLVGDWLDGHVRTEDRQWVPHVLGTGGATGEAPSAAELRHADPDLTPTEDLEAIPFSLAEPGAGIDADTEFPDEDLDDLLEDDGLEDEVLDINLTTVLEEEPRGEDRSDALPEDIAAVDEGADDDGFAFSDDPTGPGPEPVSPEADALDIDLSSLLEEGEKAEDDVEFEFGDDTIEPEDENDSDVDFLEEPATETPLPAPSEGDAQEMADIGAGESDIGLDEGLQDVTLFRRKSDTLEEPSEDLEDELDLLDDSGTEGLDILEEATDSGGIPDDGPVIGSDSDPALGLDGFEVEAEAPAALPESDQGPAEETQAEVVAADTESADDDGFTLEDDVGDASLGDDDFVLEDDIGDAPLETAPADALPAEEDSRPKSVALDAGSLEGDDGLIHWRDEMSVGFDDLDADHQVLIGLINKMALARHSPASEERSVIVGEVLESLATYTIDHFERERAYLEQVDFPDREAHFKTHDDLKEVVTELKRQFETLPDTIDLGLMHEFLRTWLVQHILREDKAYVPYLLDRAGEEGGMPTDDGGADADVFARLAAAGAAAMEAAGDEASIGNGDGEEEGIDLAATSLDAEPDEDVETAESDPAADLEPFPPTLPEDPLDVDHIAGPEAALDVPSDQVELPGEDDRIAPSELEDLLAEADDLPVLDAATEETGAEEAETDIPGEEQEPVAVDRLAELADVESLMASIQDLVRRTNDSEGTS